MSSRIPQSYLNELLARVDIVEQVEQRITLKKSGTNYSACCPFHSEKTPSFTVSSKKQFYHCFGCGEHGNAIGFLMAYEKLGFIEAVETLAQQAGLPLPEGYDKPTQSFDELYQLLEKAKRFFQTQLQQAPQALQYLHNRGLNEHSIQQFGIGFAPDHWDALLKHLNPQLAPKIIEAGLGTQSQSGKTYDRFRNRIIFPIRDMRGRVIGFGGRSLTDEQQPKYLNSPETPLFHKSNELYGLYEHYQSKAALPYLLLVEGYMDVIALHQAGITQAAATMGTATTPQHLQRLFRLTDTAIFCFDGDAAGYKAAWRAVETTLPLFQDGWKIQFIFLPKDEDPDSFIRKQCKAAFEQAIAQAIPLTDFFFQHLSQLADPQTIEGKAKLAQMAKKWLDKLQPGVFSQLMRDKLAALIEIPPEQITLPLKAKKPQAWNLSKTLSPIQRAIAFILQFPEIVPDINLPPQFSELELPGIATICQLVELIKTHRNITLGGILEFWRDSKAGLRLAQLATHPLLIPPEGALAELVFTLDGIVLQAKKTYIEQLIAKSNQGVLLPQEKEILLKLLREQHNLVE
ncbi:MAG: DNA primase [Gammaproteobacteria bacterium]